MDSFSLSLFSSVLFFVCVAIGVVPGICAQPLMPPSRIPINAFQIYRHDVVGQVLDVADGVDREGQNIRLWWANSGFNQDNFAQLFEWKNGEQLGWFGHNKCFAVDEYDKAGSLIKIQNCSSTDNKQKWFKFGNHIQLKGTTKCIDVINAYIGNNIQTVPCEMNNNAQVLLAPFPPTFAIYWKSDRLVTVADSSIKLTIATGAGNVPGDVQLFEWVNGQQIRLVGSDKCITGTGIGNPVVMSVCQFHVPNVNQYWTVVGNELRLNGGTGAAECMEVTSSALHISSCNANTDTGKFFLHPFIASPFQNDRERDSDIIEKLRQKKSAIPFGIHWLSSPNKVVDVEDGLDFRGQDSFVRLFFVDHIPRMDLSILTPDGFLNSAQTFEWVNGDQIRWVGTAKCLTLLQTFGDFQNGNPVALRSCSADDPLQKWDYANSQIKAKAHLGKCLDIPNGGWREPRFQIYDCLDSAFQKFSLLPLPTTFSIYHKDTNLVADIINGIDVTGTQVHMFPALENNFAQLFQWSNGNQLRWAEHDKCLTANHNSNDINVAVPIVITPCDASASSQKWQRLGYQIRLEGTERCLDVDDGKLKAVKCQGGWGKQKFVLKQAKY